MTYIFELKQHYVYLVVHKKTRISYIGARTDAHNNKPDILTGAYITSSTDTEFIAEIKNHPENFYKRVLKFFQTRAEADSFESYLHHRYNVDVNSRFYNRIKSGENFSFPLVPKGEGHYANKRVAAYCDSALVKIFCSAREAQRQTNILASNISVSANTGCCTGWYNESTNEFKSSSKNEKSNGFKRVRWVYVDEVGNPCTYPPKEKKHKKKNPNNRRKVAAYQEDGTFIAIFVYTHEAARHTGIAVPNISSCALGKTKHSGV